MNVVLKEPAKPLLSLTKKQQNKASNCQQLSLLTYISQLTSDFKVNTLPRGVGGNLFVQFLIKRPNQIGFKQTLSTESCILIFLCSH